MHLADEAAILERDLRRPQRDAWGAVGMAQVEAQPQPALQRRQPQAQILRRIAIFAEAAVGGLQLLGLGMKLRSARASGERGRRRSRPSPRSRASRATMNGQSSAPSPRSGCAAQISARLQPVARRASCR